MQVEQTKLPDLLIFYPQKHQDQRGLFIEAWQQRNYKNLGIKETFVQDNFVISNKNILRGLHFQINKPYGQLLFVSVGKIFDVVVDLRKDSPTFKQFFCIEISAESLIQIYMPPGFAHGYYTLSETAHLHYKCTEFYDPTDEGGLYWNDLQIPWPNKNPILSDKDQQLPKFANLKKLPSVTKFNIWQDIYSNFNEITEQTSNIDNNMWQEKLENKLLNTIAESNIKDPLSTITLTDSYPLAIAMAIITAQQPQINLLDFGGGIALDYFKLITSIPEYSKITYHLLELPQLIDKITPIIKNYDNIILHKTLPEKDIHFDCIHLGSSLQYIESWQDFLLQLLEYKPNFLILSDVIAGNNKSFVTKQYYYGKFIPVKFLNFTELVDYLASNNYQLIYHSYYDGKILNQSAPLPLENFPKSHQLHYTCNVIFKLKCL